MRRRRRRGDDAQAVLETALVIPILLLLVCNFIGLMVQVTVQQQLDTATALAAESRFQAPEAAVDPDGTRCCGAHGFAALDTSGLPTGCRYAAETFYGTMTTYTGMLVWQTAPLCTSGGDSGGGGAPARPATVYPGSPENADISCDLGSIGPGGQVIPGFVDRALHPPAGLEVVTCEATTRIDFSRTPLGWGVFWSPTVHARSEALPPPFRQ